MKIEFTKMHGCGNDYIYIDCVGNKQLEKYAQKVAAKISHRHFGVGGDGVILLCASAVADVKMRIFNADGGEARMCGNGIRCVAKLTGASRIETLSGVKEVQKIGGNYRVGMGVAEVDGSTVNIGNPHRVFFCENIDGLNIEELAGPFDGVNVEFAEIIDRRTIKARVRERGSRETLACGTGAAAVAAAAVAGGFADKGGAITVKMRGGDLFVEIDEDGDVFLSGGAVKVFTGSIEC
jgi:diaminopimelate epimerase